MMIVLFGHPSDLCVTRVHQHLLDRHYAVTRIEEPYCLETMGLTWSLNAPPHESYVVSQGQTIPLAAISAVLNRQHYQLKTPRHVSRQDQQYMHAELYATLLGLLHAFECPVINRPLPGATTRKFLTHGSHLIKARQHGFLLPPTLFTANLKEALGFYCRMGQTARAGTISPHLPTEYLQGGAGIDRLHALISDHPVYLQAVLPGQWFQVFTIGETAIAATGGFSDRLGPSQGAHLRPIELKPKWQERCCQLVHGLGLAFACLTLLRTPQKEMYCFDVNAFPDYASCNEPLQANVTQALAALLATGSRRETP